MSILKALQKKQTETGFGEFNPTSEKAVAVENSTVVSFDRAARQNNAPPEVFLENGFRIGKTNSAFNEQTDLSKGTALPNLRTDCTAGAILNADSSPRPEVKVLPDFVSWDVEPERVEPRLVVITQPSSSYCEEYRSLRTQILHKSQKQKLQSIVVASVGASEGKSVTSLNLAWLLAQTDGIKALIIDSDLRMPSLADYLGIETDKGLSSVLSETATLTEAIIKLEPSGLHLLPGGEARSDVAELLSGPKFKEILRQAREMFDFIIIDAPPLGIFTDATVLINHADGALMVVRANRTKFGVIDRIMDKLPRDRMLGVVLNDSDDVLNETQYDYGYYSKRFKD
jgi:capsular exopolysaccharide synthesis family protein